MHMPFPILPFMNLIWISGKHVQHYKSELTHIWKRKVVYSVLRMSAFPTVIVTCKSIYILPRTFGIFLRRPLILAESFLSTQHLLRRLASRSGAALLEAFPTARRTQTVNNEKNDNVNRHHGHCYSTSHLRGTQHRRFQRNLLEE